MKKNYYAVKKGLTPGIYTDWESCRAQVTGFPGAEYKGFATLAEAEAWVGSAGGQAIVPETSVSGIGRDEIDDGAPHPDPGCAIAYVDGPFPSLIQL